MGKNANGCEEVVRGRSGKSVAGFTNGKKIGDNGYKNIVFRIRNISKDTCESA